MTTYLGRIQLLTKPSTDWALNDAVLLIGEIGAADVGASVPTVKIGDGVRPWSLLPNLIATGGPVGPVGPMGPAGADGAAGAAGPAGPAGADGADGAPGAPGAAGPANTLTIGTVVSGTPASATITGVAPNQVLSLVLPQGEVGPAGPQGIQGVQGPQGPQGIPGTAGAAAADNTGTIGLVRVQGVAATAMRSDGAPPLSQAIAPTWSATHIFGKARGAVTEHAAEFNSAYPSILLKDTDGAANEQRIRIGTNAANFFIEALSDAETSGSNILNAHRSGVNVDVITYTTNFAGGFLMNQTNQAAGNATLQRRFTNNAGHVFAIGLTASTYAGGVLWTGGINAEHVYIGSVENVPISIAVTNTERMRIASTGVTINTGSGIIFDINGNTGGIGYSSWSVSSVPKGYIGAVAAAESLVGGSVAGDFCLRGIQRILLSGDNGLTTNVRIESGSTLITPGVRSPSYSSVANNQWIGWNATPGGDFTHATMILYGASGSGSYAGFGLDDGGYTRPVFMSHRSAQICGVHSVLLSKWLWYYQAGVFITDAPSGMQAAAFTTSSSRKLKRVTGRPTRAADLLAQLKPIFYRLLDAPDREQVGLIAEEVAEVCPQLSDGKTIAYDRLAILLLADWQEARGASVD